MVLDGEGRFGGAFRRLGAWGILEKCLGQKESFGKTVVALEVIKYLHGICVYVRLLDQFLVEYLQ
jgi:hypothetical protein